MRFFNSQNKTVTYAILLAWAVIALSPLFFTLIFSLKPVQSAYDAPLFFPIPFTLDNFKVVISAFGLFPKWILNSFIIAVATTATRVIFGAMGGYAFARLNFPFKNQLFIVLLVSMMVPIQALLIPHFLTIGPGIIRDFTIFGISIPTGFGLLDNKMGVILPGIVQAFGVFLMTQFYRSFPKEIEDAAQIDGLNRYGIFTRIFLPNSTTQLLTLALLMFQGAWNDFLWPVIVLRTPENFTLPIGLQWFRGEYYTLYSIVLAGSLFNTLPILILFFLFQRYFTRGIVTTGLKV